MLGLSPPHSHNLYLFGVCFLSCLFVLVLRQGLAVPLRLASNPRSSFPYLLCTGIAFIPPHPALSKALDVNLSSCHFCHLDEIIETQKCNDQARGWQCLCEQTPSPRLFAQTRVVSPGTLIFCCGYMIVCHIWQCLRQRSSRSHCVPVASGNAQQSPRRAPLSFLPQLAIVRPGQQWSGCCPYTAGSVSPW